MYFFLDRFPSDPIVRGRVANCDEIFNSCSFIRRNAEIRC